jgi:CMP-N,N'-diacetyllegionaminic acid synthase
MVKDNQLNIIGVIHARGGSVRIPLKNIKPLGGRPLISYMVRAALGSKYLRKVIVSTDHQEIKRIAEEYGAEVPFIRPPYLATDCPSELVSQHAAEFIEEQESMQLDIVVTMQPTTPFCSSRDIDACIEILLSSPELNSAFSARIVRERPEWMFLVKENHHAHLLVEGELKKERGIFQSLPTLVMPNGAVYATRRNTLFAEGVVISQKTGYHLVSPERSVDIDEPLDLLFAEFLLTKGAINNE